MSKVDSTISIVVPYRNRSATLERCLYSLVNQTVLPQRIVLVDNGSTDDSHALVDRFIAQSVADVDWLHIVEWGHGASIARNAGLDQVVTPYVAFFDSDDEMSQAFVADSVNAISHQPCDLVVASTMMRWPNGQERIRPLLRPLTLADHIVYSLINTQCFVVRTDYLRKIGGWDSTLPLWNDYELGARLLAHQPTIAYLRDTYHVLYQHEDSITGHSRHTSLEAYYNVFLRLQHIISQLNERNQARNTFALALKVSHWQGLMQQQRRKPHTIQHFTAWHKSLLRELPLVQRWCCYIIRCGTALGVRGLLHLWKLFA